MTSAYMYHLLTHINSGFHILQVDRGGLPLVPPRDQLPSSSLTIGSSSLYSEWGFPYSYYPLNFAAISISPTLN